MNVEAILKLAEILHAHERGQERLQLPKESIDEIQRVADKMWYDYGRKKLFSDSYYTPLRSKDNNLLGYATFQRVGKPYRSRLILTTILSNKMKPKGDNIGSFFNAQVQGIIPKDPNAPKPFKQMDPLPDATKP